MSKLIKVENEPHFYQDQDSGILYFAKSVEGKVFKFSCRTDNILVAKRFANKEMKMRLGKTKRHVTPLLKQELTEYLNQREGEDLSENTKSVIRSSIKKLLPYWGNMRPEEISRETWLQYVSWFEEEYDGQQIENARKYFKSFCHWLLDRRHMGRPLILTVPKLTNPQAKRVRIERQKKKERTFTQEEIQRILAACSHRDRLIVLFLYTMAFRINEACSLTWDKLDLSPEDPVYRFGESDNKASHIGTQGIPDVILRELEKWPRVSRYLFPQKTKDAPIKPQQVNWTQIRYDSEVTWGWTAHTFRHTCLTELFSNPNNAQAIIMKCYRISYQVALGTYIHVDSASRNAIRNAVGGDF